nr:PREDICTED: uncharacterized protein LOC105678032 [Linepithema humile]
MRLSHVEARLEQLVETSVLISTAFDNFAKNNSTSNTNIRSTIRLEALKSEWQRFSIINEAVSIAIGQLKKDERLKIKKHTYFTTNLYARTYENYLLNLEKIQFIHESDYGTVTESMSTPSLNTITSSNSAAYLHQARLPRTDLPKFNGTPSDWLSFKDLFSSLVLRHPSLTAVEKLQYLKTSLIGNAAQLLKNTTLTADNFERAWSELESYYDNNRILVNAALQSLLDLKKISNESARDLEQLYANVKQIYRSLEALKRPVTAWDDFLVFIVSQKLDTESVKAWENHIGANKDPPLWHQFMDFLITRLRSLRAFENSRSSKSMTQPRAQTIKAHYQGQPATTKSGNTFSYGICKGNHTTTTCPQYVSKTQQKLTLIRKHGLCFNCLKQHKIANCTSTRRCVNCGKKHHTSIHQETSKADKLEVDKNPVSQTTAEKRATHSEPHVLHSNIAQRSSDRLTLLATAKVMIVRPNGDSSFTRALLDQGSEVSLIIERLSQRLRLPRQRSSIPLVGIGEQQSNKTRGIVHFKLKPHFNSTFECVISAHVLPTITSSIPTTEISNETWTHLQRLQLADPQYSVPGSIDILLGADTYSHLLTEGIIKDKINLPVAQSTSLGWIISGPTGQTTPRQSLQSYHVINHEELSNLMQRFWELESIPTIQTSSLTPEEQDCEEQFKTTHTRDTDGRYVVKLPFKDDVSKLGDSKGKAIRFCQRLIHRCSSDKTYAQLYHEFLSEYRRLDHMRLVPECLPEPPETFYLPHHGVWKANSSTTKLRVVFNGSNPSASGTSLNELLHSGPKLQTDTINVLLHFRQFQFTFTADIEKMFRQIKVHPSDWRFQRIIWKDQGNQFMTYELTTVTYGLVCAPFLALRVLQQLISDERQHFPEAVLTMIKGRYVDDVLGGADSITEAISIVNQLNKLCMAGGFPLKK